MNKQEIRLALKDFHWMESEILRLYAELHVTSSGSTSRYEMESMMIQERACADIVGTFVIRKDRYRKIIHKLEKKVRMIHDHTESIKEDRMTAVLYCILDGMTIVSISKHLNISERNIYNIRDAIINHIYESIHKQKEHLDRFNNVITV
ncbi:hypothetical protein [Longirhabdus pacifica]|uniref:hypothetical protein n=1 Tax=Longirhabdus pacifica TaxID=2305227 RepID=UPI001008892C|nr:hypothetical protein [Longirhabdus pacifica]